LLLLEGTLKMRTIAWIALILCGAAAGRLDAQTPTTAYVIGGGTLSGMGLDVPAGHRVTIGGEVGFIAKDSNVGPVISGNLAYHLAGMRHGFDPFLVGGLTGVHVFGLTGMYLNLGAGFNYWFAPRFAFRTEFKGYAGGQDLGGFTEIRVGLTFRP